VADRANKLICTGGAGSVVAAICCFTPVLVFALPAIGLAAWLGWIDYVLWPALVLFLGITAYGVHLRRRQPAGAVCETGATAIGKAGERP
jgi:mercuric ion transport protein